MKGNKAVATIILSYFAALVVVILTVLQIYWILSDNLPTINVIVGILTVMLFDVSVLALISSVNKK